MLIDAVTKDDVIKIIENLRNSFNEKGYYTGIDTEKGIHTKPKEVGLLTDDFKTTLERHRILSGYESFIDKVEKAREKVKGSKHVLEVDLLTGIHEIKRRKLPILSSDNKYSGLEIAVEEIIFPEISEDDKSQD